MRVSRRILIGSLMGFFGLTGVGCSGADNPKITEAPPPPPPTAAEKEEPKGKPPGYGSNSTYQKAMERAATR
jgi:hypothetical protein